MTTFRSEREWDVSAAADDVREVLLDLEHYPDWWPQTVVVAHRALAGASRVLGPVLRWNHDQMMRGCERGLADRVGR